MRNTLHFIAGRSSDLERDLIIDIGRYRHKVFVKKLGWQLQCENDLEYDEFDRDDTFYIVGKNNAQEIIGVTRLLPTNKPYLLGKIFPQLLNETAIPASAKIWELSRFAAVDFGTDENRKIGQFSSPHAVRLLKESLLCAAAQGAQRLITVSPLGVERLLRKAGFRAYRAGVPTVVHGHSVFACWIDVE